MDIQMSESCTSHTSAAGLPHRYTYAAPTGETEGQALCTDPCFTGEVIRAADKARKRRLIRMSILRFKRSVPRQAPPSSSHAGPSGRPRSVRLAANSGTLFQPPMPGLMSAVPALVASGQAGPLSVSSASHGCRLPCFVDHAPCLRKSIGPPATALPLQHGLTSPMVSAFSPSLLSTWIDLEQESPAVRPASCANHLAAERRSARRHLLHLKRAATSVILPEPNSAYSHRPVSHLVAREPSGRARFSPIPSVSHTGLHPPVDRVPPVLGRFVNTSSDHLPPIRPLIPASVPQPTYVHPESSSSSSRLAERPRTFSSTLPIRPTGALFNFGPPDELCARCGAIVWKEERIKKKTRVDNYSICCQNGRVDLPLLEQPPPFLYVLMFGGDQRSSKFRENVRNYNSRFAFTSIGGKIDHRINNGQGPYIFRLCGQNYHQIGSLLPPRDSQIKFAQLYIYDTQNELQNRLRAFGGEHALVPEVMSGLMQMLDQFNVLAKAFRMARDRFEENRLLPVQIRLVASRTRDARTYNLPTTSEVAGLIVGDGLNERRPRDIIVDNKAIGLQRISETHPSFMAMQYPLLFPYGEDGFSPGIPVRASTHYSLTARNTISMREFFAYRLQQRPNEGHTLIGSGRLLQQYAVDAYMSIESERLDWVRSNQSTIRAELYQGLSDLLVAGDTTAASVGKRLVLPSSFTGGPRYMMQNFQDAIAICRWAGPPDLFITFTCNPKWIELKYFLDLIPYQSPENRPDIVARVFKIKVDKLMALLKKDRIFGEVVADVGVIEFQKRGLPHCHVLIFLHEDNKLLAIDDIDRIISAELPSQEADPLLHQLVVDCMIHGPCGSINRYAPCMSEVSCDKGYPKQFSDRTVFDQDGFARYKRPNNQVTGMKNRAIVDGSWVVPYNPLLLTIFQAHINVEYCNRTRMVKYLFKYIHKGEDRSTAVIEENLDSPASGTQPPVRSIDEVKSYLNCRYISAPEACWRIFGFDLHFRSPSVLRLTYHLQDQQNVVFHDDDDLFEVVNRPAAKTSMFIEWMATNALYPEARGLLYADFPTKWVWHGSAQRWHPRKQGFQIGRLRYAHPTEGEPFYLRMLLNVIKGPRNFAELKTVAGVQYDGCRAACAALGLLQDDNEWHAVFLNANQWASSQALRHLFITILVFCDLADPLHFWNANWLYLSDDILRRKRRESGDPLLQLPDDQLKNLVLCQLENLLNRNGKTLKSYKTIPLPEVGTVPDYDNRLMREEMAYDAPVLWTEFQQMHAHLNAEQRRIYDAITHSVNAKVGGFYFVYGGGGTGKTYLWNTIIAGLRSEGKIVLAVASSGIAALLFPGGRTAHSRFKIPMDTDQTTLCSFSANSNIADLIRKADLIVWDEAPMTHKNDFETVDRTMIDIMRQVDENSSAKVFGGKTFLLGGDFRQILPVVPGGGREAVVAATINRSHIWDHCTVFYLHVNMRLAATSSAPDSHSIHGFAKWVLDLGEGNLPAISISPTEEANWIQIPSDLMLECHGDGIVDIANAIYEDLHYRHTDAMYFTDRFASWTPNIVLSEI